MGALVVGGELGAGVERFRSVTGVDALAEGGRRLRRLLQWRQEEAEMDEELSFHLSMEAENNLRAGMSEPEARRTAAIAFGGRDGHRERIREARGLPWLEDLWRDLRYGAGGFRRDPFFTLVSVGMLAVAIGINSALVGFVDYVALAPIPGVTNATSLATVDLNYVGGGGGDFTREERLRHENGQKLRFENAQNSFVALGGIESSEFFMEVDGGATPIRSLVSVGDYFAAMRFDMALGRALIDASRPDDDQSIVLSHRTWKTHFNASPDVLGQTLRINHVPMTIVGVMPRRFGDGEWNVMMTSSAARLLRPGYGVDAAMPSRLWGRLKPGVKPEQAQAEASILAASTADVSDRGRRRAEIRMGPPTLATLRDIGAVSATVALLTTLILAIACSNVGGLLVGRGVARRREIAIRLSVGASRQRVIRQLLAEGVLLAVVAAVVGLIVLGATNEIFDLSLAGELDLDLRPNWRTIVVTLAIACVAAVLFSLSPALNATRTSLRDGLTDAAGGPDPRSVKLQRGLVVAEFALSIALGCATGLIVNSIRKETFVAQGYEVSDRVGVITLGTRLTEQTNAEAVDLARNLSRELAYIPGTLATSFGERIPGTGFSPVRVIQRDNVASSTDTLLVATESVGPDFLRTLGIGLLAGRGITEADVAGAPQVVVVGDRFAAEMWPGEQAIGRTLRYEQMSGTSAFAEEAVVVGVSESPPANANGTLGEMLGGRVAYLPALQTTAQDTSRAYASTLFVMQSSPLSGDWAAEARKRISRIAPGLPIDGIETTRQRHLTRNRETLAFGMGAAAGGLIAIGLAAIGVFAAITFRIEQRRRELAVRQALGATATRVAVGIFREGFLLALTGFVIGLPLGLLVLRVAASELSGFDVTDLASVSAISAGLLLVAALASWLPARRVTRIQPMEALRS